VFHWIVTLHYVRAVVELVEKCDGLKVIRYAFNPSKTFNMLYYSPYILQCNNPVEYT
jgi:hypothetical protein